MRPFSALAATFLLAACSAAPNDESDDSALANASMCASLDYGHTRSNADYFKTFDDDASALAYSKKLLAANGKPEPREVSTDERLNRLVAEVYVGYQRAFPRETQGMTKPPRVVVIDTPELNAFAGFDDDPAVNKAPWLFFVHTGIVASGTTDDELRGVFAHELAHLILRNVLPETRETIRRHYRVRGSERGIIGSAQPNDPAVAARVKEVQRLGEAAGRFPEFGPAPRALFSYSEYELGLALLAANKATSPAPDTCVRADTLEQEMSTFAQAHGSVDYSSLVATPEEFRGLGTKARSYAAAMKTCYSHVNLSLFELKVRARASQPGSVLTAEDVAKQLDGSTPEHAKAVKELMSNDELALDRDGAASPVIDKIFAATEAIHAKLTALGKDQAMPLDAIRVYDAEEDADDAAVRVLTAIGADPLGQAKFLFRAMGDAGACRRTLDAGKVPSYGRFVEDHPGTCYRVYHSQQFVQSLATCKPNDR